MVVEAAADHVPVAHSVGSSDPAGQYEPCSGGIVVNLCIIRPNLKFRIQSSNMSSVFI